MINSGGNFKATKMCGTFFQNKQTDGAGVIATDIKATAMFIVTITVTMTFTLGFKVAIIKLQTDNTLPITNRVMHHFQTHFSFVVVEAGFNFAFNECPIIKF